MYYEMFELLLLTSHRQPENELTPFIRTRQGFIGGPINSSQLQTNAQDETNALLTPFRNQLDDLPGDLKSYIDCIEYDGVHPKYNAIQNQFPPINTSHAMCL